MLFRLIDGIQYNQTVIEHLEADFHRIDDFLRIHQF